MAALEKLINGFWRTKPMPMSSRTPNISCRRSLWLILWLCLACVAPLSAQPLPDGEPAQPAPQQPERSKPDAKAEAEKKSLLVEVTMPSHFGRNGSATPLSWELKWLGKGILSGRLEYEIRDHDRLLGKFVIEDLTVSETLKFRTMLPAVKSPYRDEVEVFLKFVTKDKVIEIQSTVLLIPAAERRFVVLGYCSRSDVELSTTSIDLYKALDISKLEKSAKTATEAEKETTNFRSGMLQQPAQLKPVEMPGDPLGYCGMDVLAIAGSGLAELQQDQLAAIRQWIEAGGSVYVELGRSLKPVHLQFLNELAQEDHPTQPFIRIPGGDVSAGPQADQAQVLLHCGLGRAVISRSEAPPMSGGTVPPPDVQVHWRRVAAFLWKVRADTSEEAAVTGHWPKTTEVQITNQIIIPSRLAVTHAQVGDWLVRELLPQTVKTVPLWMLAATLLAYLVAIGPADYFGLGLLRLRRLTWILFPIVTIGFTIGTVWLSNNYMYSATQSRSLVVADVVGDGRIARQNRLELVFANASRTLTTEVQRGLYTPLNLPAFGAQIDTTGDDANEYLRRMSRERARLRGFAPQEMHTDVHGADTARATYVGRIPGHYTVTQSAPQWTPQLNRLFTIPNESRIEFPWTSFSAAELRTKPGQTRLAMLVSLGFGEHASAYVFDALKVAGKIGPQLTAVLETHPERWIGFSIQPGSPPGMNYEFLQRLSASGEEGMFQHFGQMSPSGADHFEDLPLLDRSGSDLLVLIWTPQGDDYVLYRRLYR